MHFTTGAIELVAAAVLAVSHVIAFAFGKRHERRRARREAS